MKKIFYIILCFVGILSLSSCDLFKIDNYDEPAETVKGTIVDVATGRPVYTDQGSEGTRIRLRELSWKETVVPDNFDFFGKPDGTYQNTKVFAGHYNVRIDGAFIPLVRITQKGDTLKPDGDQTKYVDIKGVTEVKFQVQPFLNIEWVGEPTVKDGKITASFKVTRGVSPADFKAKIEPMGGWDDSYLYVNDIRLFVSEIQFLGFREYDNRYSFSQSFSGNAFETDSKYGFGKTITITTNGVIPAGRTMFIRAAARMNYKTENLYRHNYNEAKRVNIPK